MSGFTTNAWKGFAIYYEILDRIHYTKLIQWDPTTKSLCENKKPQYFLWAISLSSAIFLVLGIPSFLFLEFVLSGYNPSRNVTNAKIFVMIIVFLTGVHSIPISIQLFNTYKSMIVGFNLFVRLQRHVFGNTRFFQITRVSIDPSLISFIRKLSSCIIYRCQHDQK